MSNKFNFLEFKNFNQDTAIYIENQINSLLKTKSNINVALSGGNTPLPILEILKASKINWEKISFFLVDERDCPNDHLNSNFFNLNNCFFKYISSKSHPVYNSSKSKFEIADSYEKKIIKNVSFYKNYPQFDLIILGMGYDGHTASLFPNSEALVNNSSSFVSNYVSSLDEWRYTLTYPVIQNSKSSILLINDNKRKKILNENLDNKMPIYRIIKESKNLVVLFSKT